MPRWKSGAWSNDAIDQLAAEGWLLHVSSVVAENPHLVNSRFEHVALSMGRGRAEVFTEDVASLAAQFGRQVSKASGCRGSRDPVESRLSGLTPMPEATRGKD